MERRHAAVLCARSNEIVVALPADALDAAPVGTVAVAGGAVRSESVREALRGVRRVGIPVVVHDAARPLAPAALFERALFALEASGRRRRDRRGARVRHDQAGGRRRRTVERTLERSRLWAVQTPQVFRRDALERALFDADDELLAEATDDAWLIERAGGTVQVVESGAAEHQDHDADRSEAGRAAAGGGCRMKAEGGSPARRSRPGSATTATGSPTAGGSSSAGSSSSTTGASPVTRTPTCSRTRSSTRCSGAAALGDIGEHFPDTDERYRDADSLELLRTTVAMLSGRGFSVVHVDATVVIERPHVAPVRDDIRFSLAQAIGISPEHVSVKATRGEGMGFVGRGEGAAALAVATVER